MINLIEIKGLCKKFGNTPVLQGIDIEIADGDIYGLVGVSGAGKSTLLRCINGILPFEEGTLPVSYTHLDVYKRQIQPLKLSNRPWRLRI